MMKYSDTTILIVVCLFGALIVFICYMIHLISKLPEPYPDMSSFEEKFNSIREKIKSSKTLKELDAVIIEATDKLSINQQEYRRNLSNVRLLGEMFRLRQLELNGDVDEATDLGKRIEHQLILQSHYNENIRSYN